MEKYNFYGANSKSISPINDEFKNVKDQRHLYDLLKDCWCKQTCAPRMQDEWNENENLTLGQCSITSFLVQDIFGGLVYGVSLDDGAYHCFNVVGNVVFDLTSEQFHGKPLDYVHVALQIREEHFISEEKYQRYLLLKRKLKEKLSQ